jgi:hypothetical protein
MSFYRKCTVTILAMVCLIALTPKTQAQSLDEQVRITFSAPVEVPGHVLPTGTYVFTAVEPGHLTRILSADGKTVYGTFVTVPEERLQPGDSATVILGENATGAPERVRAWFYPGNSTGSEFMYQNSSSHNKVGSAAKAALASTEFVSRQTERFVVDSGKVVGRAARFLIS